MDEFCVEKLTIAQLRERCEGVKPEDLTISIIQYTGAMSGVIVMLDDMIDAFTIGRERGGQAKYKTIDAAMSALYKIFPDSTEFPVDITRV